MKSGSLKRVAGALSEQSRFQLEEETLGNRFFLCPFYSRCLLWWRWFQSQRSFSSLLLLKASSYGCSRDFLVTTGWAKARRTELNLAVFPLLCKLFCALVFLPESCRSPYLEAKSLGRLQATSSGAFLELPVLRYAKSGMMVFRVFALAAPSYSGWRGVKRCLAGDCC